jgi:hypothetical protein
MENITNPWRNTAKPQTASPRPKSGPSSAETTPQQFPISQMPPPPAIVQLECPSGTLFDSYSGQCTFLPQGDQTATLGPPLEINPQCPPGSTFSTQSEACVIVEADNECPSGTYYREGSNRCVSKLKYGPFRYGERLTLLTGSFVQARPVPENYIIRVLEGSLRAYYLEDPASAENVIQRGLTQPLYNYAILSCVICPATFVTHRMN